MPVALSVVIPTFRRPAQLGEALDSVLSQEGPTIEVVVVDDAPEGAGEPVVSERRDARVTYHKMDTPTAGNPSRVRNRGYALTTGALVHFLDDDDRVLPGAYRAVAATFAAHPGRGVVLGRVVPFGEDRTALEHERWVFSTAARRARLLGLLGSRFVAAAHQLFATPTMLVNSACTVRREVFERVGGYDEEIRVMEDIDFYARAIRASGFTFLDRPFIEYRTGASSLMNDHKGKSVAPSYRRMYSKYAAAHGRLELRLAQLLGKTVLTRL